jgi:hypothetical protein
MFYETNTKIAIIYVIADIKKEVLAGLRTFGFSSFKPGQEQTVMRILNGESYLML